MTPRPPTMTMTLSETCSRDDAEALDLDEVFRAHAAYIATLGLRLLGRSHEVDDLVQDVFIEAHRRAHTLRDPGAIRGWLTTVTVRTARRRLRQRRVRIFLRIDDEETPPLSTSDASPEQRTLLRDALRVLDELPANCRIAWTLRHVEGAQVQEIAAHLDCSTRSVLRFINQASDRLARWSDRHDS